MSSSDDEYDPTSTSAKKTEAAVVPSTTTGAAAGQVATSGVPTQHQHQQRLGLSLRVQPMTDSHRGAVYAAALQPQGDILVTGSSQGDLILWRFSEMASGTWHSENPETPPQTDERRDLLKATRVTHPFPNRRNRCVGMVVLWR